MESAAIGVGHHSLNSGKPKQIILSFIASILCLIAGMVPGWSSPMTLILSSSDSPVGKMTLVEIARLLTISRLTDIPLAFLGVPLAKRFGRKDLAFFSAASFFFGSTLLTFADSVWMLYSGKQVISVSYYIATMVVPMYVSECVHYTHRGSFIALLFVQANFGFLLAFVFGKILSYRWFNAATMILAELFLCFVFSLPESPHFLMSKGKVYEAENSILWLRGGDRHVAEVELESIRSQLLLAQQGDEHSSPSLLEHFQNRGTRRALITVIGLMFITNLCGITETMEFTGLIFKEAQKNSSLGAEDSSIIIAALKLISVIINAGIIDKIGRKPLLYFSFISNSLSLSVLSCFLYFQMMGNIDEERFRWIPITSIGLFVFNYGIGMSTIPLILIQELLPSDVKAAAHSLIMMSGFLLNSGVVMAFPYMDQFFGLYSVFILPAIINALGVLFTWALVPETKGKSAQLILEELRR